MEVGSISSWIQVGITGVGFLVAFFQWRNHKQLASANHLGEVLKIFCEEKNRLAFSKYVDRCQGMEYYSGVNGDGEPEFKDSETLSKNEIEMEIDNMLLLFENICFQLHTGIIQADAFGCFKYQIHMALKESQLQRYLSDLARYCSKNGGGFPFLELVREGVSIEALSRFYLDVLRTLDRA